MVGRFGDGEDGEERFGDVDVDRRVVGWVWS